MDRRRESIVRQWTPLTFAAQWIVVACLKFLAVLDDDSNNSVVPLRRLAVSVGVLRLLIDYGANRSYTMAGRVSKDWNLFQILASTSHVLHRVTIHDEEGFVATMLINGIITEPNNNKQMRWSSSGGFSMSFTLKHDYYSLFFICRS